MTAVPEVVVGALRDAGLSVATAESLTGGLVCSTLVEVPGASEVVRGGIVAYAADLKRDLLGVEAGHLATYGTVDAGTAERMARGVRIRCSSDLGVATTGVAGPDPSEGEPAGTVFVAVADAAGVVTRRLALAGDRQEIRAAAVADALRLVLERVQGPGKDS
ncbi:MAG: CinA family protein [Nocardioidaceae bacterium]